VLVVSTRPHGEQERDRVVAQPSGGEQQRRRRLPIHPVQVIDHHQQRRRLGGDRQQRQGRGGDQVPIPRRRASPPAKGRCQRLGLDGWDLGQALPHRSEHLQQGRVPQGSLRLHPPTPQADKPVSQLLRGAEQRGLPDAGLTLYHRRAGHPAARCIHQRLDAAKLLPAAHHPGRSPFRIFKGFPRRERLGRDATVWPGDGVMRRFGWTH
jgi:hypothetical protein